MTASVIALTPDAAGPDQDTANRPRDLWPVAPTSPAQLIPAIKADGTLYPVEKIEAHIRGLHHLAFSVFVFAGDELLLQRRADSKYHCGGQWANTCCSHPHMGEDMLSAADRRLTEELGIKAGLKLRAVADYCADMGNGLWENERVHLFRAEVAKSECRPIPNPEEVSETKWITCEQLRNDIAADETNYTPWLKLYLNRFPELDF